jgi:hypothetical protein
MAEVRPEKQNRIIANAQVEIILIRWGCMVKPSLSRILHRGEN